MSEFNVGCVLRIAKKADTSAVESFLCDGRAKDIGNW